MEEMENVFGGIRLPDWLIADKVITAWLFHLLFLAFEGLKQSK